jgi:hypothetical protein
LAKTEGEGGVVGRPTQSHLATFPFSSFILFHLDSTTLSFFPQALYLVRNRSHYPF